MKDEQNNNNAQDQQLFIADVSCCASWKKIESRYVPATALMIGKIEVARFFYDGVTRGDLKYKCTSKIPTIKNDLGNYKTEDECRSVCLKVAKTFCEQLQHCS
tara:strand:+ start:453 stop:761 length:309 start_codon:yes stop_codon:yes gene_type:complete